LEIDNNNHRSHRCHARRVPNDTQVSRDRAGSLLVLFTMVWAAGNASPLSQKNTGRVIQIPNAQKHGHPSRAFQPAQNHDFAVRREVHVVGWQAVVSRCCAREVLLDAFLKLLTRVREMRIPPTREGKGEWLTSGT